jgi:uncharacterized protein
MGILTADMQRVIGEQKLGFHATVSADGTPSLSPKGTTMVWDDEHIFFADIHSPQTVDNIRNGSRIEVNVVDPFVRKGYRFKGSATLHVAGDRFYAQGLAKLAGAGYALTPERVQTIVLIRVEGAAELVSPAYDAGRSEADVAAQWERHHDEVRARREATRS